MKGDGTRDKLRLVVSPLLSSVLRNGNGKDKIKNPTPVSNQGDEEC